MKLKMAVLPSYSIDFQLDCGATAHVGNDSNFSRYHTLLHDVSNWRAIYSNCGKYESSSISLYADNIIWLLAYHSWNNRRIHSTACRLFTITSWYYCDYDCVKEEKHLNFSTNKCSVMWISRKCSCSITPPPLLIKGRCCSRASWLS